MASRGGYRPGSGRKPSEPGGRDMSFHLYTADVDAIDFWSAVHQLNGDRPTAVRQMLRDAARRLRRRVTTKEKD